MQRGQGERFLGVVTGLAMLAAACGGSGESASDDDVAGTSTVTGQSSEVATSDTDESEGDVEQEVTTTETTEAPAVQGPPVPAPDQWLDGAAAVAPTANGWPVDAGRWASSAFDPAIALDLPAGLTVVDHAPWSIRFGLDQPESTGQVHLVRTSTLTLSTDVSVPIPRSLDAIDEFIQSNDQATLSDQGRIEGGSAEIGWWELVINDELPGYSCPMGDKCVQMALTTGGTSVEVPLGEPFIVVAHRSDDARYSAYITGSADELAELLPAVEEMFVSLTVLAQDAEPPESTARFISTPNRSPSTLLAGSYHHSLGGTHIQIELNETANGISLFSSESEMFILDTPAGALAVIAYENMVADPSVSQANISADDASSIPRLDDPPSSIDEWSTHINELAELTTTGTTEIGGLEVPWFEFVVEPGSGFDCPAGFLAGAEECLELLSRWWHSDAESANRHFVFGDAQVLVILFPTGSNTIDDILASYEPILAGLTITQP